MSFDSAVSPTTFSDSGKDRRGRWLAWATLLFVAIIVCIRRPDQVLFPSFSYEAGTLMFVEDRVYGATAFLMAPAGSVGGYLVTIQRLIAFLGGFIDLAYVPLFYNICACAFLLGAAAMCVHARIDMPYRHFLALALVLVPNGGEVFLDVNLLHFLCAPVLVILMLQRDAVNRKQWLIDFLALCLLGLTGPFIVLFAVPLLIVRFCRGGFTRYNVALVGVAVFLAVIQVSLTFHSGRLAADLNQVVRPGGGPPQAITSGILYQVLSVAFAGPFLLGNVIPLVAQPLMLVVTPIFLVSLLVMAWRVDPKIRVNFQVLLASAALMYLVQLYRSRTFLTYDHPFYAGQRYFYLPYLFLCWALIIACGDKGWIRTLALSFLGLMLLSSATQFTRPLLPDTHWKEYVRFVKQGYEVVIPINPPGWVIRVGPHDRGRQLADGHNNGHHPDWKLGPVLNQPGGTLPANQ